MDAILNISKRSMMPAGHHSDSDSTLLPLPKSAITWLGGIFARLPPLAARLRWEDCVKRDVKNTGEEEEWKKKTRDRGGWKRLSDEAVKKLRAAHHP